MKITPINNAKPLLKKTIRTGVEIAACIALGAASKNVINNIKAAQKPDEVVISMPGYNLVPDKGEEQVEQKHDFNNEEELAKQGKTRHWCAAKNGPDKGSKYYRSSEYNFFGYYKKK